jgi:hypothetical protein
LHITLILSFSHFLNSSTLSIPVPIPEGVGWDWLRQRGGTGYAVPIPVPEGVGWSGVRNKKVEKTLKKF